MTIKSELLNIFGVRISINVYYLVYMFLFAYFVF